jgi:flagellar biosynthesis/type III secretory pathway protein FliH
MGITECRREGGPEGADNGAVEVFAYPACPGGVPELGWEGFTEADDGEHAGNSVSPGAQGLRGALASRTREQTAEEMQRLEAERARGRDEGRQLEREAQVAVRKAEEIERKRQLAKLVEGFALERDRYLKTVESEVVKLALAVAARILRREAQMDPLLLSGAVRVALGQVAGSTEVMLRVPATQVELWQESVALIPNLQVKPTVMPGEGMRLGDCVIECKVGSVDLGVRSQLGEIERGFFDRAGTDAAAAPGAAAGREEQERARA